MHSQTRCPVCTLYLHEGMVLAEHLETHPKDQVIKALVLMTVQQLPPSHEHSGPNNITNSSIIPFNKTYKRPTETNQTSSYQIPPSINYDNAINYLTDATTQRNVMIVNRCSTQYIHTSPLTSTIKENHAIQRNNGNNNNELHSLARINNNHMPAMTNSTIDNINNITLNEQGEFNNFDTFKYSTPTTDDASQFQSYELPPPPAYSVAISEGINNNTSSIVKTQIPQTSDSIVKPLSTSPSSDVLKDNKSNNTINAYKVNTNNNNDINDNINKNSIMPNFVNDIQPTIDSNNILSASKTEKYCNERILNTDKNMYENVNSSLNMSYSILNLDDSNVFNRGETDIKTFNTDFQKQPERIKINNNALSIVSKNTTNIDDRQNKKSTPINILSNVKLPPELSLGIEDLIFNRKINIDNNCTFTINEVNENDIIKPGTSKTIVIKDENINNEENKNDECSNLNDNNYGIIGNEDTNSVYSIISLDEVKLENDDKISKQSCTTSVIKINHNLANLNIDRKDINKKITTSCYGNSSNQLAHCSKILTTASSNSKTSTVSSIKSKLKQSSNYNKAPKKLVVKFMKPFLPETNNFEDQITGESINEDNKTNNFNSIINLVDDFNNIKKNPNDINAATTPVITSVFSLATNANHFANDKINEPKGILNNDNHIDCEIVHNFNKIDDNEPELKTFQNNDRINENKDLDIITKNTNDVDDKKDVMLDQKENVITAGSSNLNDNFSVCDNQNKESSAKNLTVNLTTTTTTTTTTTSTTTATSSTTTADDTENIFLNSSNLTYRLRCFSPIGFISDDIPLTWNQHFSPQYVPFDNHINLERNTPSYMDLDTICKTTNSAMSERATSIDSLNIRTDEKMPAKGEISEQESNGEIEHGSWNNPSYANETIPQYPSSYDMSVARESWSLSSYNNEKEIDSNVLITKFTPLSGEKDLKLGLKTPIVNAVNTNLKDEIKIESIQTTANPVYNPFIKTQRKYRCSLCTSIFPSLKHKRTHISMEHSDNSLLGMSTLINHKSKIKTSTKTTASTSTSSSLKIKTENETLAPSINANAATSRKMQCVLMDFNKLKNDLMSDIHSPIVNLTFKKKKIYVCATCNLKFISVKSFDNHLTIHPVECNTCGRHFKQWYSLSLHLKRHLGIKNYSCYYCNKRFVIRQKLIEHMRIHTGITPIKCRECPESFRRYSNLVQHRKRYHLKCRPKQKDYVCHCGEVVHSFAKFLWHKEIHDKKPKVCAFCRERFIHKNSLTRHIRLSHPEKYLNMKKQTIECHICNQHYLKSSIKTHILTHSKKNEYKCSICNKTFSTKWNLKQHRWIHASRSTKPYKCNLCSKAFIREAEYTTHVNIHKAVKPYTCDHCGCKFGRKYNWLRHTREHELPKRYQCNICDKLFHRAYYLTAHRRVHTGERPFTCNICGKTSASKTNHNKHVKIHHARDPLTAEG